MENPVAIPHVRIGVQLRTRTLKDGTIREYVCKREYTVKEGRIVCGKKLLKDRITACKDREKIERIKAFFDDMGI